jgi:hypothetical protein
MRNFESFTALQNTFMKHHALVDRESVHLKLEPEPADASYLTQNSTIQHDMVKEEIPVKHIHLETSSCRKPSSINGAYKWQF